MSVSEDCALFADVRSMPEAVAGVVVVILVNAVVVDVTVVMFCCIENF